MKVSNQFEITLKAHLDRVAASDPLFAETYKKPGKNIKDCCNYILNQAKEMKVNGMADEEVFGMAFHYYQEDDIKKEQYKPISGQVVVNHVVELTAEEIEQAKQKARQIEIDKVISAEKQKLTDEALAGITVELSDAEIEAAKEKARQEALDAAMEEQKSKLTKKAEKRKSPTNDAQESLFEM